MQFFFKGKTVAFRNPELVSATMAFIFCECVLGLESSCIAGSEGDGILYFIIYIFIFCILYLFIFVGGLLGGVNYFLENNIFGV